MGGPGSSRYLRLEVHYHNPLLISGEDRSRFSEMWAELEPTCEIRLFYAEKASNPLTKATKPGRRRERAGRKDSPICCPITPLFLSVFLHFLSVFRASISTSHTVQIPILTVSRLRPPRLLGDPPPLHAQPEALRRQHHGAGPGLHPRHGRAPQAARLPAQRILQLQVYSGCAYTCTRSPPPPALPSLLQRLALSSGFFSRLCLQEGSTSSRRSSTPTWRAEG